MKKLPLAILGTAALSIPVKAIAHDSDGLYGTPDSLSEQPPKIEESSLIMVIGVIHFRMQEKLLHS